MRSSIISSLALLLIQSSVLVSAIAIPESDSTHPLQVRANSQKPMSKAEFDKETDQMRKEFHCRLYDKNMNKRHDMSICNLKCGDLAKKTQQTGKVHSTTCTLLDTQHPALYMDLDKDVYKIGKCVCDLPVMNMVGEFTGLVLPLVSHLSPSHLRSLCESLNTNLFGIDRRDWLRGSHCRFPSHRKSRRSWITFHTRRRRGECWCPCSISGSGGSYQSCEDVG
jgi:hypothetical protein